VVVENDGIQSPEAAGQGPEVSAYGELRAIAERLMRRERRSHTLQPTALVHETYLRLLQREDLKDTDRQTFLSAAARAMRHVLIDHARSKKAAKREGGASRQALTDAVAWYEQQNIDLLALDEALQRLHELDPELARVVELRFFLGLTEQDVAAALKVSTRTVERGWRAARIWLYRELTGAR